MTLYDWRMSALSSSHNSKHLSTNFMLVSNDLEFRLLSLMVVRHHIDEKPSNAILTQTPIRNPDGTLSSQTIKLLDNHLTSLGLHKWSSSMKNGIQVETNKLTVGLTVSDKHEKLSFTFSVLPIQ